MLVTLPEAAEGVLLRQIVCKKTGTCWNLTPDVDEYDLPGESQDFYLQDIVGANLILQTEFDCEPVPELSTPPERANWFSTEPEVVITPIVPSDEAVEPQVTPEEVDLSGLVEDTTPIDEEPPPTHLG